MDSLHPSLQREADAANSPGEAIREAAAASFAELVNVAQVPAEKAETYRAVHLAAFTAGFAQGSYFSAAFTKALMQPN